MEDPELLMAWRRAAGKLVQRDCPAGEWKQLPDYQWFDYFAVGPAAGHGGPRAGSRIAMEHPEQAAEARAGSRINRSWTASGRQQVKLWLVIHQRSGSRPPCRQQVQVEVLRAQRRRRERGTIAPGPRQRALPGVSWLMRMDESTLK